MTRINHLLIALVFASVISFAQDTTDKSAERTTNAFSYGELKVGYGVTQFGDGLSERYEAGNFSTSGLYLQGDYYFTTQFTQKYRRTEAKEFDHQFAIGSSVTLGLGYQYQLSNGYALVATVEYDLASRRGEVQGIGDATFQNSNFGVQLGLVF